MSLVLVLFLKAYFEFSFSEFMLISFVFPSVQVYYLDYTSGVFSQSRICLSCSPREERTV